MHCANTDFLSSCGFDDFTHRIEKERNSRGASGLAAEQEAFLEDRSSFHPIHAGEMAEWLKAHAWKACLGETLTWVRIPLSPPLLL
jgi:hypothetical protein